MTQDQIKDWVFRILALLVLVGFIWLYGAELLRSFLGGTLPFLGEAEAPPASEQIDDPRVYVITAIATLVGGVSAVFLGVEGARSRLTADKWTAADKIRIAYVLAYVLFGAAAIVAWVRSGAGTSLEIRTLAVTFIGLVTPAVAAYLKPSST
jgi:hypothetical protein